MTTEEALVITNINAIINNADISIEYLKKYLINGNQNLNAFMQSFTGIKINAQSALNQLTNKK